MDTVLCEVSGGVATVTMNRPEALNALNDQLTQELASTLERLSADDDVRCVVLQGSAANFMAGGDLVFFKAQKDAGAPIEQWRDFFTNGHGLIRTLTGMPKPVIAAVEGAVAGYGFSLMSACDMIVASEEAVFTLAYTLVGLSPDGGASYFLPRIIGTKKTMELMLLSDRCCAEELKTLGLVNRITPKGEALDTALKLAGRIAKGPTQAYANVKALLSTTFDATLDEQLDDEQERFIKCAMSDDFDEGLNAFLKKRKPQYGR
jgi:2-(1,2-epoxy-1,2-dihydrophenyl)acetyl-CoA isomerase